MINTLRVRVGGDRDGELEVRRERPVLGVDRPAVVAHPNHVAPGRDHRPDIHRLRIARPHAGETQREVQGRGAGRDGDGVLRADELGEIFLERVEIRSGRRDPIGLESFQDEFDFGAADVRRGEVDAGERHWG